MAADCSPRIRVVSTPLGKFVTVDLDDDAGPNTDVPWEEEDVVDAEFTVLNTDAPLAAPTVVDRVRSCITGQPSRRDERTDRLLATLAEMRAQQQEAIDAAFEAWKTGLARPDQRESDPAPSLTPRSSDIH